MNTSAATGHRHPKAGETVDRVVCVSECRVHGSVFDEMHRIRERALVRNNADEVYAALLYQASWFVEWMEGPIAGVDAVIRRAASEPQHRNLRVLHRSRGPRRLTQTWSMAFRRDGDRPANFAARVAALLLPFSAREQLEPAQVWRFLSMPHSAGEPDCDSYQRVMVCSARGTRSFELVRWLGQAFGCQVINLRLEGASQQMQDVANDYLDLPARRGCMPRRVVAMARNGLQIGLFQAFLTDYSHAVLLLSGDSVRDMELVHLVLAACARAPEPPVLLGIGWTGCDHAPLRQAAKTEGLVYLDCDVHSADPKAVWAVAEPALDFSRTARWTRGTSA